MANVFLSYRRDDSADAAGRITDRLVDRFGKSSIYMDVDSAPLGLNFSENIEKAVAECDVMLAVIGPNWLTVNSEDGERRLDNPRDYVRIEIETALARQIPVIPLLVRGATIPNKESLPEGMQELTLRNGISVRPDPDFDRDLRWLINSLESHFDNSKSTADVPRSTVEDFIRADTKEQTDPRDRLETTSYKKAKVVFLIAAIVVLAFIVGVLGTPFLTGKLSEGQTQSVSTSEPTQPALQIDATDISDILEPGYFRNTSSQTWYFYDGNGKVCWLDSPAHLDAHFAGVGQAAGAARSTQRIRDKYPITDLFINGGKC